MNPNVPPQLPNRFEEEPSFDPDFNESVVVHVREARFDRWMTRAAWIFMIAGFACIYKGCS